jgi:methionyl-tRNA synthetase
VEDPDIEKLSARFVVGVPPSAVVPPSPPAKAGLVTPELSVEQFAQMELRAGKVLSVERVPKKDKLLKLTVDLGEAAARTIVSGVAQSYAPEELVGKVVCVVANLPAKSFGKGLASHGMILFAEGGSREHTVLELPPDVKPGAKVK